MPKELWRILRKQWTMTLHTKDYLASELRKAGFEEMAKKAESGFYHDFLSEAAFPAMELHNDLMAVDTPAARRLLLRHHNGEFNASPKEAEEWANSPEGREVMKQAGYERKV